MKGMSAHLGSIFRHRFCWRNSRMSLRQRIHRLLNLRFYEAYLTMLYMGIKTLFLVNVVTQVFCCDDSRFFGYYFSSLSKYLN